VLTCIRVGNKQKKIDITIPKLDTFIHKVYIHVARKIYTNVFLFEKNINALQIQKNNREFEIIIQECILMAIRDSIPTESIIRAYMEESMEQEEEVFIEPVPEEVEKIETSSDSEVGLPSVVTDEENMPEVVPSVKNIDEEEVVTRLTFNEMDTVLDNDDTVKSVSAPKNIERLEEISTARAIQRRLDEEEDDDDDRIRISSDTIDLSGFDVLDNDKVDVLTNDFMLDGIEELV
jgi:hypothetical protein